MGTALKLAQTPRSFQLPGSDRVAISDPVKNALNVPLFWLARASRCGSTHTLGKVHGES
jgi:hypothetical protein